MGRKPERKSLTTILLRVLLINSFTSTRLGGILSFEISSVQWGLHCWPAVTTTPLGAAGAAKTTVTVVDCVALPLDPEQVKV